METCALLTRLTTTTAFEPFLEQVGVGQEVGVRRLVLVGRALLAMLPCTTQHSGLALHREAALHHKCGSQPAVNHGLFKKPPGGRKRAAGLPAVCTY